MNRFRFNLLVLLLCLPLSGCASWIQEFKDNPASKATQIMSVIDTAASVAQFVFGKAKVGLPEEKQVEYQEKLDALVFAADKSKILIQSVVDTARMSGDTKPDLSMAIDQAIDNIEALKEFAEEMKSVAQTFGSSEEANEVSQLFDRQIESIKSLK